MSLSATPVSGGSIAGAGVHAVVTSVASQPDTTTHPMRWLRRTAHVADEKRRVRHDGIQIQMETGVGLTSGQGSDPELLVRWSNDAGHTWGNEHTVKIGQIGKFKDRAIVRRLGMARDRIYEVSGTDPVKIALIDAYLAVQGEVR